MKFSYFVVLIASIFELFISNTFGLNNAFSTRIPSTVALTMTKSNSNYTYFCTGVIATKRLILTTTKCIEHGGYQFKPEEINVSSAAAYIDDDTDSEVNQYEVEDVIAIKTGNVSQRIFALLYLKSPITINENFGRFSLSKPQFTITKGGDIKAAKWCKKMGVKTPRKLHVRAGRRNCGTTGVFKGNFIYYVCIAGRFFSTELCYGFKGDPPILFKDFLIGLKIPFPWRKMN